MSDALDRFMKYLESITDKELYRELVEHGIEFCGEEEFVGKYRKKPIVVEAFQFGVEEYPEWMDDVIAEGVIRVVTGELAIITLEGVMKASLYDWVIKEPFPDSNRKIYPCKPDIFERTYEKVKE